MQQSGHGFYSAWVHCRLFTAFASEAARAQQDDEAWQAAFKLSYDLGCSVLRARRQLPALGIDRATGGSHLMRLALQHQELVAAPQPVAGVQGTSHHYCFLASAFIMGTLYMYMYIPFLSLLYSRTIC